MFLSESSCNTSQKPVVTQLLGAQASFRETLSFKISSMKCIGCIKNTADYDSRYENLALSTNQLYYCCKLVTVSERIYKPLQQ